MRATIFLLVRRRATVLTAVLAVLVTVSLIMWRFVTSSSDVEAAVDDAQRQAEQTGQQFGQQLPVENFFVDPRYILAEGLPMDLGLLAVGLALVGLVGGASIAGSDWRTGTVRFLLPSLTARAAGTLRTLGAWAVLSVLGAFVLVLLAVSGLYAVAAINGHVSGIAGLTIVSTALRAVLVVAASGVAGASLAIATRHELPVIIAVLAYVVVAEGVLEAAMGQFGYTAPSQRVHEFIMSRDISSERILQCGDVPLCPLIYDSGPGNPMGYVVLALTVGACVLAALLIARRPIWR